MNRSDIHRHQAQQEQAGRLFRAILDLGITSADRLADMTDQAWQDLAIQAKTNTPKPEVREMVLESLRRHEQDTQPADPFEGLV